MWDFQKLGGKPLELSERKWDDAKLDVSMDKGSSWRYPECLLQKKISEAVKQDQIMKTCFLKIKQSDFSKESFHSMCDVCSVLIEQQDPKMNQTPL